MNGKILIADDDLGLAESLAMRCENIGLDTIVVDNAQCAQLAIVCEQPDIAVLDLNMPPADGGDVLALLETDPELSDLPVIILTGQKDRGTIQRCQNLRTHYIPKQHDVWSHLKDCIEAILCAADRDQYPASSNATHRLQTV